MEDYSNDDPLRPLGITKNDLAPTDFRTADFDWTGLGVHFVETPSDKNFDVGYGALAAEFAAKDELESRAILERRFGWRPESPTRPGYALLYEMIVVHQDGTIAAVCDHTAIVDLNRPQRRAIVHLSHLLVAPPWRGSGLAGWMQVLPLYTARECLRRAGQPPRPITLAAEMEPANPAQPGSIRALASFGKVGFLKVDPARVNYLQPDFRPFKDIDAFGAPRPLPLSLVLRRVGREDESIIDGDELRDIVESLYTMYGESFREQDMRPLLASLASYPPADEKIALVRPSLVTSPGMPGGN